MTTEMKPIHWVQSGYLAFGYENYDELAYIAAAKFAMQTGKGDPFIPGPYDGTIETAKQRCEEHRRKRA